MTSSEMMSMALSALAGTVFLLMLPGPVEGGVLYTGRVNISGGNGDDIPADGVACTAINVSSSPVDIKIELFDGDRGDIPPPFASADCEDINPGSGSSSSCDSEVFFSLGPGQGLDMFCKITVGDSSTPANFVRANMVVRFGSGRGSVSTDGIAAPNTTAQLPFLDEVPPPLFEVPPPPLPPPLE